MDMLRELGKERPIVEKELDCAVGEGRTVPLEVIAAILRDDEGALIGRIALVRDLSELQHLRNEVERSQRLAAVGSLAAGVAHEIRNPLSSLKGFATYFRQRYGGVPDDVKVADIMIQEVDRLNRVITELLEFSRPMELKRKETDLAGLVRHTLGTIEGQAREKGITVQTDLPPGLPEASIDPDRLTQVFLNLFLNAIAAMDRGGILSVGVASCRTGAPCVFPFPTPVRASARKISGGSLTLTSRQSLPGQDWALPSCTGSSRPMAARSAWRANRGKERLSRSSFPSRGNPSRTDREKAGYWT